MISHEYVELPAKLWAAPLGFSKTPIELGTILDEHLRANNVSKHHIDLFKNEVRSIYSALYRTGHTKS